MKSTSVILALLLLFAACKKDSGNNTSCNACALIGNYTGQFHDVAGCYSCIPYQDTTYLGGFTVDTIHSDSILIIRSYDNYEWYFLFSDTGIFSQGQMYSGMTFTFTNGDSFYFFYNNGGSGGYFRQEFAGAKL